MCILILPIVLLVVIAEVIDIRLFRRIATMLLINLILVLGLQIFTGNSGILSFAHIGFMGVGAYTTGVLTMPLQMKSMALPELYPALAGQHSVYTAKALTRFRAGENWGEKDAQSQIMNGSAAELTDEEIEAVASYLQGLHLAAE